MQKNPKKLLKRKKTKTNTKNKILARPSLLRGNPSIIGQKPMKN
jgi:hypothetical protein